MRLTPVGENPIGELELSDVEVSSDYLHRGRKIESVSGSLRPITYLAADDASRFLARLSIGEAIPELDAVKRCVRNRETKG